MDGDEHLGRSTDDDSTDCDPEDQPALDKIAGESSRRRCAQGGADAAAIAASTTKSRRKRVGSPERTG
jgi:hypothetical protein